MKKRAIANATNVPAVEQLSVYGTDWCPDVRQSRKVLDSAGVKYKYINLDLDSWSNALVRRLQMGKRRVPMIIWPDTTTLIEPSDGELTEQLARQDEASDD